MKHNYKEFTYTNEDYLIFRSVETYNRTDSGKGWKSKPDIVENTIIPPEHYTNYITAVPFFNNWGDGASCRAAWSYNEPGYLPTRITTVSPYRISKKVARFWFIRKSTLLKNAGYREKYIVEHAKRFEVEYAEGTRMIHFCTEETGDMSSGIFDTRRNTWRG